MSGLIGSALRKHLDGRYSLRALNRKPVPGVPCHQADIADLDGIQPAFVGVDVVAHLAALAGSGNTLDTLLGPNIVGTYNVFEAARRAGVKRVSFASSGATVSSYEREEPYRTLTTARPVSARGNRRTRVPSARTDSQPAKVWGGLARHYADGTAIRQPTAGSPPGPAGRACEFSVWCSQRDVVG
jgi:nucleoside-diphosphate-sugar epimerase